MKKIFFLIIFCVVGILYAKAGVVQTDPVLTAAIIEQTETLKKCYAKRQKTEEEINANQVVTNVALAAIHNLEDSTLKYLQNASVAMDNLYDVKRVTELIFDEIPNNIAKLTKAVAKCPKGAAIAAVADKSIKKATEKTIELYPFVKQLVQSGSYNVQVWKDGKQQTVQKKVNLLNSYERLMISKHIVYTLENVNRQIYWLSLELKYYDFRDLWRALDREGYWKFWDGVAECDWLCKRWRNFCRSF